MMAFSAYLIVGALIGLLTCYSVLKVVTTELEDEELNNHPVLEKIKYIIDVMGLQQFFLVLFIMIMLFWAPITIHRFLTNRNEE